MGRCNAEMITRRRIRDHDEALADATGLSHETAFAQLDVHNRSSPFANGDSEQRDP